MSNERETEPVDQFVEDSELIGRHFQQAAPSYPDVIQLEITAACNLKCVMCPIQIERRERGADERVISLERLEQMRDVFQNAYEVELTGFGEFLCHPRVLEVLRFLRGCGVNVHATSNGMLLDAARATAIVDERLIDLLAFSLDAANAATHQAIRPGGDFETIKRNICRLAEIKRARASRLPYVHFNFLALERNIDELPDFVRLAAELGAEQVIVQGLCEGAGTHGLTARGPRMLQAYQRAVQLGRELGVKLEFWYMPEEAAQISGEAVRKVQVTAPKLGPTRIDCLYPWERVFIKSNLDVQICATLWEEMVMGNLRDQTFIEIWQGAAYSRARDQMRGTCPPEPCALRCTSKERRLPHRPAELKPEIDLGQLNYDQLGLGFYPREYDQSGRGCRWVKQRATLFLANTGGPLLRLELGVHPAAPELGGSLWVNGRCVGEFATKALWRQRLDFLLPPLDDAILQVELRFERSFKIGEVDPAAGALGEANRPISVMLYRAALIGRREQLQSRIDFASPLALDFGWYEEQSLAGLRGRWSGPRCRFALADSNAGWLLLDLHCATAGQRVSVTQGGHALDSFRAQRPGPMLRTIRLPADAAPYRVFELRVEPVWNPPSPDTRRLGVFLADARIEAPTWRRRFLAR